MSELIKPWTTSAILNPSEKGEAVSTEVLGQEHPANVPLPRTKNLWASLERPVKTVADASESNGSQRSAGTNRRACSDCRDGMQIFPFTMAFQPIVDLQDARIDGYEALVRGPAGEGAGQVLSKVNTQNIYAFDQACRVKAIELAAHLGIDRHLSINFLPNAVYEPRACIQKTLKTAERTGFPLSLLTFEILESEDIGDAEHLINIVHEYRQHGFKIALDDFATGYSGLARLANLKPDIAKIDRVLASGCDKDSYRLAIIAGMVHVGREVGTQIVVEGVERVEEVEALRSIGVRFIQGFYFGKPLVERIAHDEDIPWLRVMS